MQVKLKYTILSAGSLERANHHTVMQRTEQPFPGARGEKQGMDASQEESVQMQEPCPTMMWWQLHL